MKLSFTKTIEGHEIEFVRLMYPHRYDIYVRVINANPLKATLKKQRELGWVIEEPEELPGWLNEISLAIQEAIEENEADAPDTNESE